MLLPCSIRQNFGSGHLSWNFGTVDHDLKVSPMNDFSDSYICHLGYFRSLSGAAGLFKYIKLSISLPIPTRRFSMTSQQPSRSLEYSRPSAPHTIHHYAAQQPSTRPCRRHTHRIRHRRLLLHLDAMQQRLRWHLPGPPAQRLLRHP